MTVQPYATQSQAQGGKNPEIHVVLVEPMIPHNTGAIGRLCVGLEARLHLIEPCGFSLSEKAVRRSGLDYWQFLDLQSYRSWQQFLDRNTPGKLHFLSTKGQQSLYKVPFTPPCWLVFGNESRGLPPDFYQTYAADLYRIPQPGEHARSINLANAAAIAMYEAHRQIAAGS
jgi:tRNA (cytidine/uridine-2'-O-)-methyltransferase